MLSLNWSVHELIHILFPLKYLIRETNEYWTVSPPKKHYSEIKILFMF